MLIIYSNSIVCNCYPPMQDVVSPLINPQARVLHHRVSSVHYAIESSLNTKREEIRKKSQNLQKTQKEILYFLFFFFFWEGHRSWASRPGIIFENQSLKTLLNGKALFIIILSIYMNVTKIGPCHLLNSTKPQYHDTQLGHQYGQNN